MEAEREVFLHGNKAAFDAGKDAKYVPGCVENGISETVAEQIWDKMAKFASYAFNKSHALCYAYIGYITAYMRCHWPAEFYAAMMNAFIAQSDSLRSYLAQAHDCGLKLYPPDIQKSEEGFMASDRNGILYGLQGILGLKSAASAIVAERNENGPFEDPQDLYDRMVKRDCELNSKSVSGLVYSRALRSFSTNEAALLKAMELAKENQKSAKGMIDGQSSLFDDGSAPRIGIPNANPLSEDLMLQREVEVLGMYVTGHPTDAYASALAKNKGYTALEKIPVSGKKKVHTLGLIRDAKVFYTKAGKEMAAFQLETQFAKIPCVVFQKDLPNCKSYITDNTVICVEATLGTDMRNDALQLHVSAMVPPALVFGSQDNVCRITVKSKEQQNCVIAFLKTHAGNTPVTLVANGKEYKTNFTIQLDEEARAFVNGIEAEL